MSSFNRSLLVCTVFCARLLAACGGSADDAHVDGNSAGSANSSAGSGTSAGSSNASAGSGNTAGASNPSPPPNGTQLSSIDTDAKALALCNQIRSGVSDADLKKMLKGSCAISGQTGAASQLGTCQELQADCAEHSPIPSPTDGSCTADDIPDCDDVTVDEYIACTRGTLSNAVAYLSAITCETDLESLDGPGTAAACVGPFARCPEYAAMYQ